MRDSVQHMETSSLMPIQIEGVDYFTAADLQRELGVVRQTLWRWRKAGKVPLGRKYRDRHVVFTREEVATIREYSNRLEPLELTRLGRRKSPTTTSRKRSV